VEAEADTPERLGEKFGRYMGGCEQGVEYYRMLTGLGLGNRVSINFRPRTSVTWDFSKL
jgi:hypothetical protein